MRNVLLAGVFVLALGHPGALSAQTWEGGATTPLLRDIVAVDATGEDGWPFGSEDVAEDGPSFGPDEARLDVRSAYAAADGQLLWVRAYVSSTTTTMPDTAVMWVFVDADDNPATGSGADATDILAEFDADPSPGGYELAVGVGGDGSELDLFEWDEQRSRWRTLPLQPGELAVEAGIDVDPLRIGDNDRAYLQLALEHAVSGLDATCSARLFVRTFDDTSTGTRFGDLNVGTSNSCVAIDSNANDVPDVLETASGCRDDADCPGDGICLDSGACLAGFDCQNDGDCGADEVCDANRCVRVSQDSCQSDSECNGLVCDDGLCVACADGTARACGDGLVCGPTGVCIDGGTQPMGPQAEVPDEVQGGACTCRIAAVSATRDSPWSSLSLAMVLFLLAGRRRRSTDAEGRNS